MQLRVLAHPAWPAAWRHCRERSALQRLAGWIGAGRRGAGCRLSGCSAAVIGGSLTRSRRDTRRHSRKRRNGQGIGYGPIRQLQGALRAARNRGSGPRHDGGRPRRADGAAREGGRSFRRGRADGDRSGAGRLYHRSRKL